MAKISGRWAFNTTINPPFNLSNGTDGFTVDFSVSTGNSYVGMHETVSGNGSHYLYFGGESNNHVAYNWVATSNKKVGWTNGGYRTVDFGTTEQTVSDAFLTWMQANATPEIECFKIEWVLTYPQVFALLQYSDKSGSNSLSMSNSSSGTLLIPYNEINNVFFVCRIQDFTNTNNIYGITVNGKTVDYLSSYTVALNNLQYYTEDITIGTTNTIYSTDNSGRFGFAFKERPTSTPTTITYNGTELASLEEGQTANFDCSGKKAVGAVSIAFGSKGSITYKGKTTEIEKGKTANLLCAGKKFATDVVVAVASTVQTNFILSDGSVLKTSDGNVFIAKEA